MDRWNGGSWKSARAIGALTLLLASSGCSMFELGKYKSFGDWYVGPPGFTRALEGTGADSIDGDRPPIYGHFRTFEILFQPVGGWHYPARSTATNGTLFEAMAAQAEAQRQAEYSGYGTATYTSTRIHTDKATESLSFDWYDGGLVELVPYRTYASDEGVGYKVGVTLMQPLNWCWMLVNDVVIRAPVYVTHDVLKMVMVPVAAIYYAGGDEEKVASK
jgi:hypothetical protein